MDSNMRVKKRQSFVVHCINVVSCSSMYCIKHASYLNNMWFKVAVVGPQTKKLLTTQTHSSQH